MSLIQRIIESTGATQGDKFTSAEQVRDYMTFANICAMFGACDYSQGDLDRAAESMIADMGLKK